MKRNLLYIIGIVLATLLASCEHKELCYDHNQHVAKSHVRIKASWELQWQYGFENQTNWSEYTTWLEDFGMKYEDLLPVLPTGLRMHSYHENGNSSISNLDVNGETTYLQPGKHSLLFYNNDTEYIVFDEMHSFASAKATTRTRNRTTYLGNSYMETQGEEYTVNPPDMLYGNYLEDYVVRQTVEPEVLEVTLHPLVFTYLIRYEFASGQEYASVARGALAGMARSVYLHSGHTSEEEATLLFDCEVWEFGMQAIVRSFGIPDFPNENYGSSRAMPVYALNLEVRLKNGKLLSFDFDVTDQVKAQPQGGIIVVKDIVIPEEDGKEGSSGFDVEVEGWGDYEDVELPL